MAALAAGGQKKRKVAHLKNDAPGFGLENEGPVCWKCKGCGLKLSFKQKRQKIVPEAAPPCPICRGSGRVPPKCRVKKAQDQPGYVTKMRAPPNWKVTKF
jgi:hypothetical protein